MEYKNLEVTPGIPTTFTFEVLNSTFLKKDLTNHTFKFEIFDSSEKMVISKNIPVSVDLGEVTFDLSAAEGAILKYPLYSYRLVSMGPMSSTLEYKGFMAVGSQSFSPTSTPLNSSITLPDGTIYVTTATDIVYDQWYAISSFFRFMVYRVGILVIDGKDLRGTVWKNRSVFESNSFEGSRWIPDLNGMTAFRIKQVVGSNDVKYLP